VTLLLHNKAPAISNRPARIKIKAAQAHTLAALLVAVEPNSRVLHMVADASDDDTSDRLQYCTSCLNIMNNTMCMDVIAQTTLSMFLAIKQQSFAQAQLLIGQPWRYSPQNLLTLALS